MSNPFLSSTHASAYLRASQNNRSTFRSALYKTVFFDPHEFLALDGPVVYRRSEDPFSEGSFTITSGRNLELDGNTYEGDSGCFLSDDSSPELTLDGDEVFCAMTRKITKLENRLYGPPVGTEMAADLQDFLAHLDLLLPNRGIMALKDMPRLSHQSILSALADRGHLLLHVLEAFRSTNIRSLSLTETLRNDAKTDLPATHTLIVLSYPNSFRTLSSLDLTCVALLDSDVRFVVFLPALQDLFLGSTGISNIGVFQLVALPRLVKLVLAYNPRVDNDSVAVLVAFARINYLDLVGTGIDMTGARRLAAASLSKESIVILPVVCGKYLSKLDTYYLTYPPEPLITDPSCARTLSYAQLKSNLSAHAAHNRSISVVGTKGDLVARLEGILTSRALDLAVLERFGNYAPKEGMQVSHSTPECWPDEDE